MSLESELRDEYMASDFLSGSAGYRDFFVAKIKEMQAKVEALTKDRDAWKDACDDLQVDYRKRLASAGKKLKAERAKVEALEADVASWKRLESEAAEVRDMACGQVKALEAELHGARQANVWLQDKLAETEAKVYVSETGGEKG